MKTSSVDALILELLNNQQHLTAHQVYEELRPNLPAVNPSTIYRALERLANSGKVSVSDMGTGAAVYEKVTGGVHHHLVCQKCKQVITIDHEMVSAFFEQVEERYKFKVATNHLILFGVCAHCSSSE